MPQDLLLHELAVRGRMIIVDCCNIIGKVCEIWFERNPVQIGEFDANGHPIVVKIDESKFVHRNNTGVCGVLVIGCLVE